MAKFKDGVYVWSRQDDINNLPEKGRHCTRAREFESFTKKSQYYNNCWVMSIEKALAATCCINHLHNVSRTSPTQHFVRVLHNKIDLIRIERNKKKIMLF